MINQQMTLREISKKDAEYITSKDKHVRIIVVNIHAPARKKNRFIEVNAVTSKLLAEIKAIEDAQTTLKLGWFEEEVVDKKTGRKKIKSVYYSRDNQSK